MADSISTISIPVPTDLFRVLCFYLDSQSSERDPVEVVASAISYWIENADPGESAPVEMGVGKGFSWKTVYLPNQTMARMRYRGEVHIATILDGKFTVEGQPTTPARFVQAVTGTVRNAWRDLEIKRPTDGSWIPARALQGRG